METNTTPNPQLQVGLMFNLQMEMDMSEDMEGTPAPLTAVSRQLCLSYHLRGLCKPNCGNSHAYRTLLNMEHGILASLKSQLWGNMLPPVVELYVNIIGHTTIS